MTERTKQNPRIYIRTLGNELTLNGEISPCVFMYEGYPLQVEVTLRKFPNVSLGIAFLSDRTKNSRTITDTDVERLLAGVAVAACGRCDGPAFDPRTVDTNRGGFCESCFLEDLNAEIAIEKAAEQIAHAEADRRFRNAGMRFRVTSWIHPEVGGDDYQKDWYFQTLPKPTKIRTMIRGEGSSVLDDYTVIELSNAKGPL